MFKLLLSIGGGILVGSAARALVDGVQFRAYHSPRARAEFEQTHGRDINKAIEQISWDVDDLDPRWFDR